MALAAASAILACAGANGPFRNRLDLTTAGEDAEAISAQFASRVSARYGLARAVDVTSDLERAGFACRAVAPVEARTDYLVATCDLPRPHGFCSDRFVVDLRHAGGSDEATARVRADGRFMRACTVPGAG